MNSISTKIQLSRTVNELESYRKELIEVAGNDMDVFNSLRELYIRSEYRLKQGFTTECVPYRFTNELTSLDVDVRKLWT